MVQERRGMLRVWNVSLICATFVLSLLGTFLVRSGVLQSIHAFGESKVGVPLLFLIGIVAIGSTVLIASRRESLQSERRLDSLLSRESVFLINNILLVSLAVIILFGTFFPLISDLVGDKSSIGPPWFNRFATPLAIGLVFFMGIGPLVAWRRVTLAGIRRSLGIPIAATLVGAVVLALTIGISESPTAYALFVGGIFTVVAIVQEVVRGVGARRSLSGGSIPAALGTLLTRNRRRYGGYIVHVGLVLALFGVAASSSFQTSRDLSLKPGQSAEVGDYTIKYERPYTSTPATPEDEQKIVFGAVLSVSRDGEEVTRLTPSREYHSGSASDPMAPIRSFFEGEATSEVGRDESLTKDLWSSMQPDLSSFDGEIRAFDEKYAKAVEGLPPEIAGSDEVQAQLASAEGREVFRLTARYEKETPPAEIRFNVNPFVIWFWLGGMIGVGGALFALWPGVEGRRRRVSDV
jgi:cytochrome c-type biogenesis protein CcmF